MTTTRYGALSSSPPQQHHGLPPRPPRSHSSSSSYSPLLTPITENSPPVPADDEEVRPLIINPIDVTNSLKRKHLNPDCTHWVHKDYQTIITDLPDDDYNRRRRGKKSFKVWFKEVFWSTPTRRTVSIVGVVAFSAVILAASGYFILRRLDRLPSLTGGDG